MNGQNPIHIVSDMIRGMEGVVAEYQCSSCIADKNVLLAEEDPCAAFDSAMGLVNDTDSDDGLIKQLDQEVATNLISSVLHPDADFR